MATDIEIIVGTYEEFVVGYRPQYSTKEPNRLIMFKSFADHGHSASVRSVASSDHFLATGGADDKIFLYSLKTREQIDSLLHHNGTVNALAFTPDSKYLLTGGSDGQLAAVNVKKLKVDKVWKNAHKGAVRHISVHPTGKLGLTLGDDMVIRTWNLINGRQAYATNLKNKSQLGGVSEYVEWSPSGEFFALAGTKAMEVWSVTSGQIARQQQCPARPTSICWISDDEIIVALENGTMMALNLNDPEVNLLPISPGSRIKCVRFLNGLLAVAASNGDLMLFQLSENNTQIDEICFTNMGCRPTCLAMVDTKKCGIVVEIKEEEEEVELGEKVVAVDGKNKNQAPEKKVEKKLHSRGRITVEFEDETPERSKKKKARGEEDTADALSPAKKVKKKQTPDMDEPKSSKKKSKKEVCDEVGELEDIIDETIVKPSSGKKSKRASISQDQIDMPPPATSSIKKSKKQKPEATAPSSKTRKKLLTYEDVSTPHRKSKKATPEAPPAVDKRKKGKSRLNKTLSELENVGHASVVSKLSARKRKSVG